MTKKDTFTLQKECNIEVQSIVNTLYEYTSTQLYDTHLSAYTQNRLRQASEIDMSLSMSGGKTTKQYRDWDTFCSTDVKLIPAFHNEDWPYMVIFHYCDQVRVIFISLNQNLDQHNTLH